jgi:site-specific DNA-methyltransferase (adenine-specific)
MTQHDIFGRDELPARRQTTAELMTYQTPAWAAEQLVTHYYGDLSAEDLVLEPTCGEGHFLDAIPHHVPAVGVELDVARAAIARRTGREVLVGDVLSMDLGCTPTLILGNPPFEATFVDALLDRAHRWLPDEGRCGLILPAFVLSTSSRLSREAERWSIAQDMIPRELFPHLRLPVIFARFEKRRQRTLVGFTLFADMMGIRGLTKRARFLLENGRAPTWKAVVLDALRECGGEATLDDLYRTIEGRRPTANPHWRPKIRQVVHHYAVRTGAGRYALPVRGVA